jgi:hypothetical protein
MPLRSLAVKEREQAAQSLATLHLAGSDRIEEDLIGEVARRFR